MQMLNDYGHIETCHSSLVLAVMVVYASSFTAQGCSRMEIYRTPSVSNQLTQFYLNLH
jgi:hypothetical protein